MACCGSLNTSIYVQRYKQRLVYSDNVCDTPAHYGQRQQVGALAPSTGAAAVVKHHSDKMPVLRAV